MAKKIIINSCEECGYSAKDGALRTYCVQLVRSFDDYNSETGRRNPIPPDCPLEDSPTNEAIEFAEWLILHNWQPNNHDWYKPLGWGIHKTSKELYEMFKNEKKGEKG